MTGVRIYHNPGCGTSRNVLALLRERGVEPAVVLYLKTRPGEEELAGLVERSGLGVRAFLRSREKLYAELDLGNAKWSEAELLGKLAENPALLNRPVVETAKGVRVCRPAETVLEIL